MKRYSRIVLLLSLVLGPLTSIIGQEGAVHHADRLSLDGKMVRHWSILSGLPSDSITALYQDRAGYLWVGTFDSVFRFDGASFDAYDRRHTPGLLIHSASVFLESDNRLWIGSVNEGLAVFQDQAFTTFTTDDGMLSDSVMSLEHDSAGRLWVGTNQGLQLGPDDGFALPEYRVPDPFARQGVTSVLYHEDWGLIAAAQQGGIYVHADENPVLLPGSDNAVIRDMIRWGENKILAGTSDGRVVELTSEGMVEISNLRVAGGPVRDLQFNPTTGRLWIASDSSLACRGPDGVKRVVEEPEAALAHTLKSILEDSEGNLWLGTRSGGLFAVTDSRFAKTVRVGESDTPAVNSVAVESDGGMWIASDNGLHHFEEGRAVENRLTELLDGIRVKHVQEHDGELYVSTISPYGLVYTEGTEIRFLNEEHGMPSNVIKMSLVDSRGVLWISTSKGVVNRESGQLTVYNRDSGFIADEIYQINEDSKGVIWVCTVDEGLVSLDRNGAYRQYGPQDGLEGNMVFSCYEDLQGNYWISTTEGVFLLDRTDRLHLLDYSKGLPYLYAYNAVPVGDMLVLTSVAGVATTSIGSATSAARGETAFVPMEEWGIEDGLSGSPNALSWPTYHKGGLWIPTHRGADYFPLDRQEPEYPHRTVDLHRVTMDGEPCPGSTSSYLVQDGIDRLEFHYSYPSLSGAHRMVFSSRLVGYQEAWSEPADRRSTIYTNVGTGEYTFQVRWARVPGRSTQESDISWSGLRSFPVEIRRAGPRPVLLLSVPSFLAVGAVGFLALRVRRRRSNPRLIAPASKEGADVAAGESSLSDSVKSLQTRYALTERETEYLVLLSRGMRDKEIAKELGCAVSTVSNSFSRIYKKTGVKGRTELVALIHR